MKNYRSNLVLFLYLIFIAMSCTGQNQKKEQKQVNRNPVVAGRFYPSNPAELNKELATLYGKALPGREENVLAIIAPHAGYVFSGEVAATSFNQINGKKNYKDIFLIGPSHRVSFPGASIYDCGDYITPLGTVEVDIELARKLNEENKAFSYYPEAHNNEHCLEVLLPFLQYKMKTDFKIVPIIIGTQSEKTILKIAEVLKPYFNDENLFIISSDFSHYPKYDDAVKIDKATADAIVSNSPEKLLKTLNENAGKNIPNLVTSLCGQSAVLTLLNITKNMADVKITSLQYKNSGDVAMGDKSQVVGYYSIIVTEKQNETGFKLTEKDKKDLLGVARLTIEKFIKEKTVPKIDASGFSENLKTPCGAFVTLHKNGNLRGCIGNFSPDEPLYLVVREMAISASSKDYRFSKVKPSEVDKLEIEISVLTPMKKIESIDEIELGKHGIYIKKGWNSGTFLPQVATQTGWDKEEFLGHCARDKAGIGWDGWKNADVFVYEAIVFGEGE